MNVEHECKILPEHFNNILAGLKSFEVRKDDREPPYPYDAVIRMENKAKSLFHCYVSKNTARRVSWCYEPDNAIKYKNQKAAEKAAVRLRSRFLGWEFTVEII